VIDIPALMTSILIERRYAMKTKLLGTFAMMGVFIMLIGISTGCGGSSEEALTLEDIPIYPGAVEGESMEHSSPGGIVGANMIQYSSSDSFDDIEEFYSDALDIYDPDMMSHTSELGRQTAFSIPQDKGMISVSIQEFTEEETVNITFMKVGR